MNYTITPALIAHSKCQASGRPLCERVRVFLCQKKSAPSIQKQALALARLLFSFLSHHAGAGMLRLRDALHRIVKYLFCRV
jgi:hypothetical protein